MGEQQIPIPPKLPCAISTAAVGDQVLIVLQHSAGSLSCLFDADRIDDIVAQLKKAKTMAVTGIVLPSGNLPPDHPDAG